MSLFHKNTLLGASGAGAADEALYVDDVFSTFLYAGKYSGTTTITNGLDLDGEGGLVWLKSRNNTANHALMSSDNSFNGWLSSNNSNARAQGSTAYITENSDGFTINNTGLFFNDGDFDYVSWSFRKAPGFFDIVTYTGNGANRTIAHNLGSVPGSIWVKKLNSSSDSNWKVWHRGLPNTGTDFLTLNESGAYESNTNHWNSTAPTSTHFSLGTNAHLNNSGDTYVAYIFAHDDQSFGTNSDEAIIKCGAYTGNQTSSNKIDLGFEPQFLIMKRAEGTGDWYIFDNMRGWGVNDRNYLEANTSDAEGGPGYIVPTSTGFEVIASGFNWNESNKDYIYIAIRRPHKPPTDGDDVFEVDTQTSDGKVTTSFPVDSALFAQRASFSEFYWFDRLRGREYLNTNARAAGGTYSGTTGVHWDYQDGYDEDNVLNTRMGSNAASVYYSLKRAPGFFDVATYTSDSSTTTFSHNLGVAPELMINKCRSTAFDWWTYAKDLGANKYLQLQSNAAAGTDTALFGNTHPTATQMTFGSGLTSENGRTYVVYLFATLDGISKVGTYSGTGSDVDVDCGFSAGARFVLIKRTDSTGDWYVWDTSRGIAAENDPYKLFNTNGSEVTNTDYIDPLNSGFTVTSSAPAALNASGGTYLFLAIA